MKLRKEKETRIKNLRPKMILLYNSWVFSGLVNYQILKRSDVVVHKTHLSLSIDKRKTEFYSQEH